MPNALVVVQVIALGHANPLIQLKFVSTYCTRLTLLLVLLVRFELDLLDVAFDVISD